MATLDLTATETAVGNTVTYVSQNDADHKIAFLPAINDGSGATVAVDYEIRVEAIAGGSIEVRDNDGRRVGTVPGYSTGVVAAKVGAAESMDDFWSFRLLGNTPTAFQSISASPSQAEVEALRNTLVQFGFMLAE